MIYIGFIMVNKWNRTRDSIKNRNIRIAMRGRVGEERGLACEKLQENLSENSSYLTTPLRDPTREEANAGTNNVCKSYYYG